MTEKPTIVVEVRGPSRSGVTSLMELLALHVQDMEVPVSCPSGKFDRIRYDLETHLRSTCCRVEVREAEPDDRDRELGSLRQERDRLKQDVERLQRRAASLDQDTLALSGCGSSVDGEYVTKARYDRLLTAFHDATRRPLGVTPDSGLEFYDARMADEAEARRSRYGRGPK